MEPLSLACQLLALFCLGLGALGGAAAGFCIGLYRGEKGRRQAAESLLVLGVPEAAPAARVRVGGLPAPIEPTHAPKGFDDASIAKGARIIQEDFKAAGKQPPSDTVARQMASDMLRQAVFGPEDDLSIAGAELAP